MERDPDECREFNRLIEEILEPREELAMTPAQIVFLRRLLAELGESDPWIEVPRGQHKTVRAFEDAGLIMTENRCVTQTWARLKKGDEIGAGVR